MELTMYSSVVSYRRKNRHCDWNQPGTIVCLTFEVNKQTTRINRRLVNFNACTKYYIITQVWNESFFNGNFIYLPIQFFNKNSAILDSVSHNYVKLITYKTLTIQMVRSR